MTKLVFALLLLSVAAFAACRSATEPPIAPAIVDTGEGEEVERITITDRTGHVWDITHAVNEYGFVPEQFQFGIGRGTIAPVFDPQFVGPGEVGYPNPESRDMVLGADLEGDARGYLIFEIGQHEVINDRFGDAHVSVAY